MDYDGKILMSEFYSTKNFVSILTFKKDKCNDNLTEIYIGPRKKIKLKNIDKSSLFLYVWYKNEDEKIFYKTINVDSMNFIEDEGILRLNITKYMESLLGTSLEVGSLTVGNYVKHPISFTFDSCKNGLIIEKYYWVDWSCYKTHFYISNDTIKIKNEEINEVEYSSEIGDMDEFYNLLKAIMNGTYEGEFIDVFDFISSVTRYIEVGDTIFTFKDFNKGILSVKKFNKKVEIKKGDNLKTVISAILATKNETDFNNLVVKMKMLGL